MGFRSEWFGAAYTTVSAHRRGETITGEPVPEDEPDGEDVVTSEVAVVFAADEGAVLYGSRERVEGVLTRALAALRALPAD